MRKTPNILNKGETSRPAEGEVELHLVEKKSQAEEHRLEVEENGEKEESQ